MLRPDRKPYTCFAPHNRCLPATMAVTKNSCTCRLCLLILSRTRHCVRLVYMFVPLPSPSSHVSSLFLMSLSLSPLLLCIGSVLCTSFSPHVLALASFRCVATCRWYLNMIMVKSNHTFACGFFRPCRLPKPSRLVSEVSAKLLDLCTPIDNLWPP
jgi:hypothetical protein